MLETAAEWWDIWKQNVSGSRISYFRLQGEYTKLFFEGVCFWRFVWLASRAWAIASCVLEGGYLRATISASRGIFSHTKTNDYTAHSWHYFCTVQWGRLLYSLILYFEVLNSLRKFTSFTCRQYELYSSGVSKFPPWHLLSDTHDIRPRRNAQFQCKKRSQAHIV